MKLTKKQILNLENEAKQFRNEIIDSVSRNGGHLSSNLGVVELTIAIHNVFDLPNDVLIFDVSHQCYTHKLLTNRTLEKMGELGKISGFTDPNESEYDTYSTGHSSTSISFGIGEAIKNQKLGLKREIVVVIGDAAINNGLAIEALNYLSAHKELKVIIIVNDNNMSISPTSTGITKSLNRFRATRKKALIYKITPKFMHPLWNWMKRIIKGMFYKRNFFDAFNIKYFAGIDGHNFKELYKYLSFAKKYNESIILHVNTIKGKGYKFAEEDKLGKWHNVGPFDKETGEFLTKEDLVGPHLCNHLIKINEENNNIKVITAAMSLGNGIESFKERFPNDFIDVGIAEDSAVAIAASIADQKIIPFVFIYSSFLQRSYDQIINDVARCNKKVIFMVDRSGIIAKDGSHHQGIFDLSILSPIPNLTILAPSSINEAIQMIDYAIKIDGPVVIRYPKSLMTNYKYNFDGNWQEIYPINNYNVITYNSGLEECMNGLKDLNVGLINASIIKPLDIAFLNRLNNKSLIIYEEVTNHGGLFDLINYEINKNNLNIDLIQIAVKDTYLESGLKEELKNKYHLGIDEIKKYIK